MIVKIREKDSIAILDLEGSIDINASNLVETVGWVLENKGKDMLCNFSDVNFVDYVGISLIAVMYKNVLNHKGRIKFYAVPPHVSNLFSIVGLDRVLECYATEEQALGAMEEDEIISKIAEQKLRRKFKRIPFKANIENKQKFSRKDIYYKGKIVNLSADGVFVVADQVFSVGDLLVSRIHLLPKPGALEVDTKVVWMADEEIQPEDFPGMGLEFHNISNEKQKKIIGFVEKHLTHSSQE